MSWTLEQIEVEALRLPEESRARLAARLMRSLRPGSGPSDENVAQAWVEEAERRDREMTCGAAPGIPAEAVFAGIRASLKRSAD
jgi:hypothetical protein